MKKLKKKKRSKEKEALYFGYEPDNNRFGDTDLSTPFVWKKKWEKELPSVKGKKLREIVTEKLRKRSSKLKGEIDSVKELREKRKKEKAALELMREDMQKLIERENYGLLNQREERFLKEQVREGAIIRVREARERPFDSILKVIYFSETSEKAVVKALRIKKLVRSMEKDGFGNFGDIRQRLEGVLSIKHPYEIVSNETSDKEGLFKIKKSVEEILELGDDTLFWKCVLDLLEFFLSEERNVVKKKVHELLDGKSISELKDIKKKIKKKTAVSGRNRPNPSEVIDFEYWEDLLKHIKLFKAKVRLTKWHNKALDKIKKIRTKFSIIQPQKTQDKKTKCQADNKDNLIPNEVKVPTKRNFNPEPHTSAIKCSVKMNESDFIKQLEQKRKRICNPIQNEEKSVKLSKEVSLYYEEANKPMEEGEEFFASAQQSEVLFSKQVNAGWEDKFRPRKPLYFNKIKTGYDWNNYNRTHYDSENPPPKIVQGYKFNIFYPDLIDKSIAPSFSVEPFEGDSDFAILRFRAGAPYEDIAFKIVNKEWNKDLRKGYRTTFSGGVLHLFFNFLRYSYRR